MILWLFALPYQQSQLWWDFQENPMSSLFHLGSLHWKDLRNLAWQEQKADMRTWLFYMTCSFRHWSLPKKPLFLEIASPVDKERIPHSPPKECCERQNGFVSNHSPISASLKRAHLLEGHPLLCTKSKEIRGPMSLTNMGCWSTRKSTKTTSLHLDIIQIKVWRHQIKRIHHDADACSLEQVDGVSLVHFPV